MAKTYVALMLDEESKVLLTSLIPPKHAKVFAEHVTVAFKPNQELAAELEPLIGQTIVFKVFAYAEDEDGQAVVLSNQDLRRDLGMAHITISCSEKVKPVYSNTLLAKGFKPLPQPITLVGTYEWR